MPRKTTPRETKPAKKPANKIREQKTRKKKRETQPYHNDVFCSSVQSLDRNNLNLEEKITHAAYLALSQLYCCGNVTSSRTPDRRNWTRHRTSPS